jgi:hypothetical protein
MDWNLVVVYFKGSFVTATEGVGQSLTLTLTLLPRNSEQKKGDSFRKAPYNAVPLRVAHGLQRQQQADGMPLLRDHRQLALNADCVAFCPTPGDQDLLVAGCYELDEATGCRRGRLYSFRVRDASAMPQLLDLGSQDLPGRSQQHNPWLYNAPRGQLIEG